MTYDIRKELCAEIGAAVIARHELQAVAAEHAAAAAENAAKVERAYMMLAQCIRSGQVPEEDVPGIMASDQGFAEWYARTFPRPEPSPEPAIDCNNP